MSHIAAKVEAEAISPKGLFARRAPFYFEIYCRNKSKERLFQSVF